MAKRNSTGRLKHCWATRSQDGFLNTQSGEGTFLSSWHSLFWWVLLLAFTSGPLSAAQTQPPAVVPKWGRFEQKFKSAIAYANSFQEAVLTVVFTSPSGQTNQVFGFWDGGRTWRVRFAPNQVGRWSFKTFCSDEANRGLHSQTGEFICTAALDSDRFSRHGPLRVARDNRHFEHADGTPFFWLADTTWSGARVSQTKDWEVYAAVRSDQNFNVAQWAVAPGDDRKKEQSWLGAPEHIALNPEFFQRLDARIETLRHVGMLSAISPFFELASETSVRPADDQLALFVRYLAARWGADPVAWLLAFEGDGQTNNATRWKKVGRAVFGNAPHAPVLLFPGPGYWLLDEFRDQNWVDAFGIQTVTDTTEDALKWAIAGPLANEWKREPARPLIAFAPCENGIAAESKKRFSSEEVRRAIYWSLLGSPSAGVSYCSAGVAEWDISTEAHSAKNKDGGLPLWRKALFLPAAKQMASLAELAKSIDFWQLQPQPNFIATQPGLSSAGRYIAAAGTEGKDVSLIYVPEDRTLEVLLEALPPSPLVSWFNPRTGEKSPAVAVVGGRSCQFPTPDPGDWVLVMRGAKKVN